MSPSAGGRPRSSGGRSDAFGPYGGARLGAVPGQSGARSGAAAGSRPAGTRAVSAAARSQPPRPGGSGARLRPSGQLLGQRHCSSLKFIFPVSDIQIGTFSVLLSHW